MTERIRKTMEYLWENLSQSPYLQRNPGQLDYRYRHSLRVAAIGAQIAREDGLDEEALVLGCLLHDISYRSEFKTVEEWKNHGRVAAKIARPWLLELGLDSQVVEELCYGIAIHVDDEAGYPGERTLLAELIGDCDNIDRYDAYRTYETLESDGFSRMGAGEQIAYLAEKLPRMQQYMSVELSTPAATRLWQEKARNTYAFHVNLYRQLVSPEEFLLDQDENKSEDEAI
jgi:uncharacterized protein